MHESSSFDSEYHEAQIYECAGGSFKLSTLASRLTTYKTLCRPPPSLSIASVLITSLSTVELRLRCGQIGRAHV